jgi:hypothetical protein
MFAAFTAGLQVGLKEFGVWVVEVAARLTKALLSFAWQIHFLSSVVE